MGRAGSGTASAPVSRPSLPHVVRVARPVPACLSAPCERAGVASSPHAVVEQPPLVRACLPCCLGNLVPDSCSAACGVQTLFRVLPARPPDVCSRPAAAPMATPHITPLSGPAGEVSVSDHYKVVLALTALGPCVPRPLSARGRSLCAQAPALDSCARVPRSRSTDAALLGSAVAASARASHSRWLVRAVVADALCGERVRGSPIRLDSLRCAQSSLSSSVFAARVSSGGDDTDRVASAQRQAPPGKPPSFPVHCAACGAG